MTTPEAKARQEIDQQLEACGWILQDMADMNIMAGLGVAVRELLTSSFDPEAKQRAETLVTSFRQFIEDNKAEIEAISILYSRPYAAGLRYSQVKELARRLSLKKRVSGEMLAASSPGQNQREVVYEDIPCFWKSATLDEMGEHAHARSLRWSGRGERRRRSLRRKDGGLEPRVSHSICLLYTSDAADE